MSNKDQFLEALLQEYEKSFDLSRDYEIGGVHAEAYGYFSTVSEKYVLSPKANLWSVLGFEHILFLNRQRPGEDDIETARRLMAEQMAPRLVCRGEKYPPKDHMYSYLTVAILSETTPEESVLKAVRSFRYEKDYLFTIRGHVEGHLLLMDLSAGKAYACRAAKHLVPFYEDIFSKTRNATGKGSIAGGA